MSDELINQIQKKANLVRIVSKYILLNNSRKALKGRCPFHNDDTTSLMVMTESNIFKCFGCGVEGGPVDFISRIESKPKEQAARELAEQYGFSIN
ncbi:CHC2 zinc finger domain-containing protein [Mucilaginibacter phyllosphaerae]